MSYAKKMSAFFLVLFLGLVGFSCKSTTGSTSKNDKNNPVEVAEANNSNGLSGLSNLSSSATTSDASETESGMMASLPFTSKVRMGILDNGMRYYIRKNAKPENRIELRLAVNAGSMQEDDDQLGLAHFVEHMAFNGTTNFKKNDLINFLEKTGVRFGADLNAYTSFDETVYMLQLPTDKEGLVDKGLLVMSDWATGIAFEAEEIDKERGVIESEWRTGLGADERMRHVWWPKVFYKTRYANRLPIGTMDIIQNAPHDRFRRFYKDWYRPNLQAIIVVGDLDVDAIEAKIKEKFSSLKNPENPREKKTYEVPGHDETFVAVATDKEATSTSIQLYTKLPAMKVKTLDDYRTTIMHQLYNSMLSGRLDEISQQNEAPFIYAGSGYSGFVRSKDAYFSSAQAKEGGIKESLKILLTENNRVLQHGFTETELERQKLSIYKRAENSAKEMDKTTSSNLAMQCVYHFLNNSPMFGANKELQLMKEFLPTIKIEEVNKLAKNWIIDKNRAVVITAPEKESMVIPTEDEIKKILVDFSKVETEAYKDKFLDMPLMAKVPTAGTVIKEKTIDEKELNITEFTLSNGIRVIMKPTDFQNDKILFYAYSPGGHSLYGDDDFQSASKAAVMIEQAGLGAFDMIALEKKLTGKTVQIVPYIDELYEGFYGSSSVEDFETLLKLVHLYGTQPRKDEESFDRLISQNKEQLRNLGSSPRVFFQNELSKIKFNGHIRRVALPTEADMDKIDYERIYEIYNERFSDFSDFTFAFVGNFEPAKIKSLLELYLASLPNTNRKETWTDIGLELPQNGVITNLQKGLAPQANVYMGFVQETPWSAEKSFEMTAMSKVLSIMVRENLREDKGGVYSPYVGGGLQNKPMSYADLTVYFQCAPENVENLVNAVKDEVTSLIENGPSDENYNKVKETLRRGRESNLEKNSFWRNALVSYSKIDRSMTEIFDYDRFLDQLTKKDIQAMAKQYLAIEKAIILTVKPEEAPTKKP